MAKSRDKIQQLGFWDPEVSKPDHDTVCLWAYENAEQIFKTVCPELFDHTWHTNEFNLDRRYADLETQNLAKSYINDNPRPNPRVVKKTLEFVLTSHTGYQDKLERIVGYADLLIETAIPGVGINFKPPAARGMDDEFDGFKQFYTTDRAPRILVEAKSVLPTVGELMRQIQLYRTAFSGRFVVVSPDDRYAQILTEQDVTFIKYAQSI